MGEKENEIGYPERMTEDERRHALGKPFSDAESGKYLCEIGMALRLLPHAPARILDLGAGTGWTSHILSKSGYEVVGQDIAPEMTRMATASASNWVGSTARFITSDFENLNFEEEFDGALFYDSLHHASDPVQALRCVHRSLKFGGVCVLIEPGEGHSVSASSRRAVEHFGVSEHDMPPREILRLGAEAGFRRVEIYDRRESLSPDFAGLISDAALPSKWRTTIGWWKTALRMLATGPRQTEYIALGYPSPATFRRTQVVRLRKRAQQ